MSRPLTNDILRLNRPSAQAPMSGPAVGGVVSISEVLPFQSYFDSTALEAAILPQVQGSPIVSQQNRQRSLAGYSIGLDSASETPIAVQLAEAGSAGSGTYVLRPGDVIRPFGDRPFSGFVWGLPYGWLGGGVARILVGRTLDAQLDVGGGRGDVLFHRTRLQVRATSYNPAALPGENLPLRFPWENASARNSAGSTLNQPGEPALAIVEPTRTVLRLRLVNANAITIRFLFFKTDPTDQGAAGTFGSDATSCGYVDVVFPSTTASGIQINSVAPSEFPYASLDEFALKLGGQSCVVIPVNISGQSAADAVTIDMARYGKLG